MPAARLTPAQQEEARRLYLSDTRLSVDAMAAGYGVGRTVMLDVLKGITRPRGGRAKTTMTTETMRRLYEDQGFTLEEIGAEAGISRSGVLRRIQRAREAAESAAKPVLEDGGADD